MTSITVEATKPLGVKPRDAERSKNFFALGLICWMYTRPTDPLVDWIKKRFASRPEVFEANVAALQLWRDRRVVRSRIRGQARAALAGRVSPDHRQRRALLWPRRRRAGREAAAVLRLVSDHAGVGHLARALEVEELRREDAPGRRRDLGGGHCHRRRVRREPGDHRNERSGHRPEVGGAGARSEPRAPDDRHRRAAWRPVDRPADQDRASRPAARDVRAPRRSATASRPPSKPLASRSSTARP